MRTTKLLLFILFLCSSHKGFSQDSIYMVADAHMDTQWNWDVQTTIGQYIGKTVNDNVNLFIKYPNYKFNFEGAIKYMWLKEYYPDLYAKVKTYVGTGQWNIAGSSLDADDAIVPSTESQIRNILIGQTFYKKEFNKKSNDIFLPDCFGFGYSMPTIMKHCGLIGFSTQKLAGWGGVYLDNSGYHDGAPYKICGWQGVDGSKILAVTDAGDYGRKFTADVSTLGASNTDPGSFVAATSSATGGKHKIGFRYYGTGDQGGAPEDATVGFIEQGITNPTGPLKVVSTSSTDFFNRYFPFLADFPTYNGELLMKQHGAGCYTSKTMMKRWNRKNELMADAAERSSVIADWLGGLKYPASTLNDAWIKVIWHQFHDDLTGTSIPSAYKFSQNDEAICQTVFSTVLKNAVGAGVRTLNTQTTGTPVVVYNPLSVDRSEVVEANISTSTKTDYIKVFDKLGVEVPAQVISSTDTTVRFIFVASVKSVGYEVYDAQPSSVAPVNDDNLKISNTSLENLAYKVTINSDGDISSVIDKLNANTELFSAPSKLTLLNDVSSFWPSWEILYDAVISAPIYVKGTPDISIVENGPVRVTLKIVRTYNKSIFVQYVRLTNCDSKRRVDVDNEVTWKTKNMLLKASFFMAKPNISATYDLGIGVIKRNNNNDKLYEVPAQQWADITSADNSYGVSILNDCKYGWDKPNNSTLRLSLIHTPYVTTRYMYEGDQDLGSNKFTYSIFGHTKTCLESGTTFEGAKLNQPLIAFEATKHDGTIGKNFSLLNIDSPQVILKTLKKAESSNDYVLRFYETTGQSASNVKVKFASGIEDAKELNGIEEEIGAANFLDSTLTISMNAFQPKTFKIHLKAPANILTLPESKPIVLPYNADVITNQNNMADGNFDGNTNSYAAELLPDTIVADGIKFKVGSITDKTNNVVKCAGNTIDIPTGYKKLYILAASSNVNGTKATFIVGSTPYTLTVDYFSSFIAQASTYSMGDDTLLTANYFKKENIAYTGSHMHTSGGDKPYSYTYIFKYCLLIPDGATQITLPNSSTIAVFAITAANNENDDTKAAIELLEIQKPDVAQIIPPVVHCAPLISQLKAATASGMCGSNESPSMAVDGNTATKWCQNIAGDKWLALNLGKLMNICEWKVMHAGLESENFITKDFRLEKMVGTKWVSVDALTSNNRNTTDRTVTPFVAQNVRLYITNSGDDDAARIYEFQLFGTTYVDPNTGIEDVEQTNIASINISPNPISNNRFNIALTDFENENKVTVSILDINGKLVYKAEMNYFSTLNIELNGRLNAGVYFVTVAGKQSIAKSKFIVN